MPYGLQRNKKGEWTVFNRECQPLGFTEKEVDEVRKPAIQNSYPIFTKYKGLTDALLRKIIESTNEHNETDVKGKLTRIWFYHTLNAPSKHAAHWPAYAKKLKLLAKLEPK